MATQTDSFVHLRVRSAYSLLEGAIKADTIGRLSAAEKMPAVALTDRANLFGALEFSVTTKDARDLQVEVVLGLHKPLLELPPGDGVVFQTFDDGALGAATID